MYYREYLPSTYLAPYVQCYWILRAPINPFPGSERLIPDGNIELIFNFGAPYRRRSEADSQFIKGSHLVGERTEYYLIEQLGEINHLAVRFKPGGLYPFVRLPLVELTQQAIEVDVVFGPTIGEVEEQLFEAGDDLQRVDLLERFLLAQLNRVDRQEPLIQRLVAEIMQTGGQLSITTLAGQFGVSYKQVERKFLAVVGVSPKFYSKIVRFLAVFDHMKSGSYRDWNSVAFSCGYYDQAHFIRDFKQFTGLTPGQFFGRQHYIADMLTSTESRSNFYNTKP
jgi:AraC-like DNA-binding protein